MPRPRALDYFKSTSGTCFTLKFCISHLSSLYTPLPAQSSPQGLPLVRNIQELQFRAPRVECCKGVSASNVGLMGGRQNPRWLGR